MKIIAPVLLFTGRLAAGAQAFEGVVGGTSYYWGIEDKIPSAKAFNDRFRKMHDGKVPSDYGAMGYTGVKTLLMGAKAAGTLDTDKVIEAVEALKYDYYKGPEYYRKCDHQAVQSVFIIESKSKPEKGPSDVFNVIATDEPSEKNLRTCEELGHKS
jgi:branched-chain amino acid transport system substrate-binding protein